VLLEYDRVQGLGRRPFVQKQVTHDCADPFCKVWGDSGTNSLTGRTIWGDRDLFMGPSFHQILLHSDVRGLFYSKL